MVKITKTMQPKHEETLSPWLKNFCQTACRIPLSNLDQHLATFPTRWPFPRGDLYHWISLLNRFDNILERIVKAYKLEDGPQTMDFGVLVLMDSHIDKDGECPPVGLEREPDGDLQLVKSVLTFSRMLLRNCGNRSLYASSPHLNCLLNTTSLSLLEATLFLGSELAQRYQAAVKRMHSVHPKHSQNALLSHYNINLDRVTQLALPFTKTTVTASESVQPSTPVTPSTSNKGKEKEKPYFSLATSPNGTSSTTYATDLVSMVKASSGQSNSVSDAKWESWGDVKLTYYPKSTSDTEPSGNGSAARDSLSAISPSVPDTPTPVRRSSNLGPHGQRHARNAIADDVQATPSHPIEEASRQTVKSIEIPSTKLKSDGVHDILRGSLTGLPQDLQYQLLNKLRVASALTTSLETRQQLLAIRLLAITNLAYIYPEPAFLENVMKQDGDEPRRLQLAYQLAELVHPPAEGDVAVPRHLQSIVLTALDALGQHPNKYQDVCTALNTNVNHGVLLYVVRTAVAELTNDNEIGGDQLTEVDEWRDALFALISSISVNPRTGGDLITAGIMPILVEVLALRNPAAKRYQPKVLNFLDNIMYSGRDAFQTLADADGLDVISNLIVFEVSTSAANVASGNGVLVEHQSTTVDYQIPYFQQQTLKWLFKFIHHMMSSAGTYGANSDRLLRNLIDSTQLLSSLRQIISNSACFGSIVWTNAVSILNDFINNEPTSFAVIAEAGLSKAFLETVTGKTIVATTEIVPSPASAPVADHEPAASSPGQSSTDDDDDDDDDEDDPNSTIAPPARPSLSELQTPRSAPLARGIMPTAETINIVPQAFGAICLNNAGMTMFQQCGALESFFEIFESPEHVKCMNTNKELPNTLGSLFDELVRHHPPLKKAILNAVLNMVTRVSSLCKMKGEKDKIGAKLWTRNASGVVIADQDILDPASSKLREKIVEDSTDVEMQDADVGATDMPSPSMEVDSNATMTPYIAAVASFLVHLFNNNAIRSEFCASEGAIDFVLDFADSPCLSHDFAEGSASRTLRNVISLLTETKPHLTLPSLLRRAQTAVDHLAPLADYNGNDPFFKAFIIKEAQVAADPQFLAKGTTFVKAFVNLYSLVSTIHSCFVASSYSGHRSPASGMSQLNLSDYYVQLVQTLGPLVGAQFRETFEFIKIAPSYWKVAAHPLAKDPTPGELLPDSILDIDATSSSLEAPITDAPSTAAPSPIAPPAPPTLLTKADKETPEYKNFQVLHHLLRKMTGTLNPFFQILGRSLVQKRTHSDAFQKQGHVAVADALAESILRELSTRGPIDNTTRWMGAINGLQDMLIDHSPHNERPVQTITLVLQAFKDRGGFEVVNKILESMAEKSQSDVGPEGPKDASPRSINAQVAGIATQNILSIYNQLVNGKNVTDAVQTVSMTSRENRDRSGSKPTHFSAPQFLVELRMAVLPVVRRLWESKLVESPGSIEVTRSLIDVIRTIASADNEQHAFKRSDNHGPIVKGPRQIFKMSGPHLDHLLSQHFDRKLAMEALYRCNNNLSYALEYCSDLKSEGRPRYPIPEADRDCTSVDRPAVAEGASSRPTTSNSAMSTNSSGPSESPSVPPLAPADPVREAIVNSLVNQPIPSDQTTTVQDTPQEQVKQITVDDLNEVRDAMRDSLIDKCLDVINAHGEVTFEVADLIQTFASRLSDKTGYHKIVAETLVLALMSFAEEEDIRTNGKKIAAYAHLLALLLRDKSFYGAAVEELQENLTTLLGFIKLAPDHSSEEPSPWIGHILLIVEMLLSQDSRPHKTKWVAPKDDNEAIAQPVLESVDPAVPEDERNQLLNAIMEILPRVGKDESLALSVLRVLVILTRNRKVAQLMGEKKNLQRLFVMAKQLAGASSSRHQLIHGPMMAILRHVIEDDETIKQMMRSDIKISFETIRPATQRHISTQQYIQGLTHAVIRSPELFVEVTNELVKYGRWSYHNSDNPNRANNLVLKDRSPPNSDAASKSSDDTVQPTVQATEDLTLQDIKPSTEGMDTEMPDTVKVAPESKFPIVENPDGVIHYLLCELLNFRDVQETESTPAAASPSVPASTTSINGDTAMVGTPPVSAPPTPYVPPTNPFEISPPKPPKSSPKLDFKAEEHPIFIYRCLLLQCLTELLGSYNRTKLEFINFKRSAPPQAFTPSKPRSSVINYLLFDLVPVGTLEQADSIGMRKKLITSFWADSVLTALLSKTGEHQPDKGREQSDGDDEPDLLFVRKFVLDHILKAYREASSSNEPLDSKYARMFSLAELMGHLMNGKEYVGPQHPIVATTSQKQLRRMMFEKGFIPALTASIADVDLNFPGAKRAVKHILRPLKSLTNTAINLSELSLISTTPGQNEEDEIESATSVSDAEDDREETPDLFRNSTLGMFEPGREEDSSSDSDDDDEEMYEEGYEDEMDYDEEPEDAEDNISEDEDIEDMGEIEGLNGDHGVDVDVIIDGEDDDEDEEGDESSDEEHDSDDDDARVEIIDETGDIQQIGEDEMEMDGWGTDGEDEEHHHDHDDEEDYEGEGEDDDGPHHGHFGGNLNHIGDLIDALGPHAGADPMEILQRIDANMDADEAAELDAAELEAEREAEEAEDDEGDMPQYMEDEDDEGGEMDEDDEDEQMFLGFSSHQRHLPFGWEGDIDSPVIVSRGHNRPRHPTGFPVWPRDPRDPLGVPEYRPYRSHRPGQPNPPRLTDDGTNPLLQRHTNQPPNRPQDISRRLGPLASFIQPGGPSPMDLMDLTRGPFGASPATTALFDMIRSLPDMPGSIARHGGALQFHITAGPGGDMPREFQAMFGGLTRRERPEPRRETSEPLSTSFFTPQATAYRWNEEAKLLFGNEAVIVAVDVKPAVESKLVPPAIEANKAAKAAEAERLKMIEEEAKKRQEEERLAKEAREAEEKIEREKKEAEEREAAERAAAEALAARGDEPETTEESGEQSQDAPEAMEGVEGETQAEGNATQSDEPPAADRPRVTTIIRGNPFDITDLGIDAEFLAELPEEIREEVIMSTVAERRSQAAATGAQPSEIDQEFLDALPDDIRDEIIQQERQDRRRRERDEQRRAAAAANGGAGGPVAPDMDAASILATLPPALRQQILMEQDEDILNTLPREMADQARAAQRDQPPHPSHRGPPGNLARRSAPFDIGGQVVAPPNTQRPQRRPIVQMLDKSGIATLLRMMFTFQHASLRTALNSVLENVSLNRQNRIEVLSTLLHILQDGSVDMSAVERSFAHLSLRAKQPPTKEANPKTPQPLKRTFTGMSGSVSLTQTSSEASPLMVVQQCLAALSHLTRGNPHVPPFFLTEHDATTALRRTLSKKGKGRENKASKYAINSLLCLLDRDLIMESSPVMELLSTLLSSITAPLQALARKQKEAEESKKTEEAAGTNAATTSTANDEVVAPAESSTTVAVVDRTVSESIPPVAETEASASEPSKPQESAKEGEKKQAKKEMVPPVIPDANLKLVINIFVARECSSRTFRETLSTIKNLSAIPGAKTVFGHELITKAQALGEVILVDLVDLLPQIQKAATGTEIQGVALAKFSPGGSDQNKLLRVLTALDHLFDPKRDKKDLTNGSDLEGEQIEKQDLLSSLYENSTFGPMWEKLSACLSAIRQREHMLNVATILLPLIEALMVVCKNTTSKDAPVELSSKKLMLASPDPESRMDNLFFTFTEEHRKILNDLVRHTPKLMSGTFSLLVKNPKVLEFDNKRNYFSRSIHNKASATRQSFPPLQLNVRREHIFHDSFRSLYFQTADQMKYGKLNIRFHGEEGVDAGGVTREWFQVLSRQMFDPGYALFIPVSSDRTTFHPNQLSSVNDEHLRFFKFIGRIIGKALYENRVLDCHFSRAVYKRILGKSVSLKDMESLDPDYYKSLVWMLENDITDIITETFSVDNDKFGVVETIDFKPNGRNIAVTEDNKHEYVQLMVQWKLTGSVKEQLDEFLKGFHDIIPAELVAIFNEQELELLISGLPEIDVDDWKSNTEYQNYSASSPQIQWFWRAVRSYDKEERAKLLQFVTGTSKVPLNGFKELEGMNGFSRFNIHRDYGSKDRLPTSHTCFNQLDLPEYDSYESLRSQILTAITAGSSYFGFA